MENTENIIREELRRHKHALLLLVFWVGTLWQAGNDNSRWWIGVLLTVGFLWNLVALVGRPSGAKRQWKLEGKIGRFVEVANIIFYSCLPGRTYRARKRKDEWVMDRCVRFYGWVYCNAILLDEGSDMEAYRRATRWVFAVGKRWDRAVTC